MINQGFWSEEQDEALKNEKAEIVKAEFLKVEKSQAIPIEDVFDYIYSERTPVQEEQYNKLKSLQKEVK
eukprot:TRINITY_DN469_c0_g1_i1.p1 TRINITY_DN469_c0_g1~~TRINITY_DN469_c0_g1_i1.p1  ORF type:complete len:69 (-),score=22.94 TRINITY_DN469_c0_g1_i1:129-335(-)